MNTQTPTRVILINEDHPLEIAIKQFGSAAGLARELGIAKNNVSIWRRTGVVPFKHRIGIEQLTGGVIKAVDFEQ